MRVRALPVHDELVRDGESVVLLDGHLLRLSPVATAIRALAREWVELDRLAALLEDEFGAPEGVPAVESTAAAVADLHRSGVVAVDP